MTGVLKRKDGKFVVEYWYERTSSHAIHPNQTELPLHPLDALENPPMIGEVKHVLVTGEELEVEFDIAEEVTERNSYLEGYPALIQYAKIKSTK